MSRTKADAIKGIADLLVYENISFKEIIDNRDVMDKMLRIKGIGQWTANYVAMRAMSESDVLLDTDYAVKKLFKEKDIRDVKIFDKYKPYRTYLTIGLWEI